MVHHRKWYRVFAVSTKNGWRKLFETKGSAFLLNRDGTYDIVILQLEPGSPLAGLSSSFTMYFPQVPLIEAFLLLLILTLLYPLT